jgi:hypothetical protein
VSSVTLIIQMYRARWDNESKLTDWVPHDMQFQGKHQA